MGTYDPIHVDELVTAFWRNWLEKRDEDFWAWEEVDDQVHLEPDTGWTIILLLLDSAPSHRGLDYAAAGPLEDLLKYHGGAFIDRISEEVPANERLLFALAHVIIDEQNEPIYSFVKGILKNYNVDLKYRIGGLP